MVSSMLHVYELLSSLKVKINRPENPAPIGTTASHCVAFDECSLRLARRVMAMTGPRQHMTPAHLYRNVFFTTSPTTGAESVMAIELGRRWEPDFERLCWKTISNIVLNMSHGTECNFIEQRRDRREETHGRW